MLISVILVMYDDEPKDWTRWDFVPNSDKDDGLGSEGGVKTVRSVHFEKIESTSLGDQWGTKISPAGRKGSSYLRGMSGRWNPYMSRGSCQQGWC